MSSFSCYCNRQLDPITIQYQIITRWPISYKAHLNHNTCCNELAYYLADHPYIQVMDRITSNHFTASIYSEVAFFWFMYYSTEWEIFHSIDYAQEHQQNRKYTILLSHSSLCLAKLILTLSPPTNGQIIVNEVAKKHASKET